MSVSPGHRCSSKTGGPKYAKMIQNGKFARGTWWLNIGLTIGCWFSWGLPSIFGPAWDPEAAKGTFGTFAVHKIPAILVTTAVHAAETALSADCVWPQAVFHQVKYLDLYIHYIHYIILHTLDYITFAFTFTFTLHYITVIHTLHHITSHYIILHYIALHCITLHHIHYITLHYFTLLYFALHYFTIHYIHYIHYIPYIHYIH